MYVPNSYLIFLRQKVAKVFKGKKMPGQMGNVFRTNHGLKVRTMSEYARNSLCLDVVASKCVTAIT